MQSSLRNLTFYRDVRPGLRRYAGRTGLIAYLGRQERLRGFYAEARVKPVFGNMVLYEAYAGKGMLCNPAAIFEFLIKDPRFAKFRHVWSVEDPERAKKELAAAGAMDSRVEFVKRGTKPYFERLARAKYLINNVTFPPEFDKRDDQVYLNTWHGTPLKNMGVRVPSGHHLSRNVLRNFLHADFLLSSGEYMTSETYGAGYQLPGLYQGTILECGSPRVEAQFEVASASEEVKASVLERAGLQVPSGNKVVLFAPTWRGAATFAPENQADQLYQTVAMLNEQLSDSNITVVLKPHQLATRFLEDRGGLDGILVSEHADTGKLLGAVDALITDYSSVAFDYLCTRGPLFWFVHDEDEYERQHGLTVRPSELYGEVSRSLAELAEALRREFGPGESMAQAQGSALDASIRKFAPHEHRGSLKALVSRIFFDEPSPAIHEVAPSNDKARVLFYAGGLERNGITASAVNVISSLDPTRYDITLVKGANFGPADREAVAALPSHVRVIGRIGAVNVARRRARHWHNAFVERPESMVKDGANADIARSEAHRMFGSSEFDAVVDYAGYTPFWQAILLGVVAKRRVAWQHNDLAEEMEKVVDGKFIHRDNLSAIFKYYSHWDAICSVSEALAQVNQTKLADYLGDLKIDFVPNLINERKIRAEAASLVNPGDALLAGVPSGGTSSLEDLVAGIADSVSATDAERALARARLLAPVRRRGAPGHLFVSAGRFSPEKNHRRLLDAFAKVYQEEPTASLIICGTGPLFSETVRHARALGLDEAVSFPGHVSEMPYLMSVADSFVLSSDHEGQPVVILEALAVGTPVVVTAFDSVDGVPDTNQITICQRDVDSLSEAMLAQMREETPASDFDIEQYNADALARFEAVVSGRA